VGFCTWTLLVQLVVYVLVVIDDYSHYSWIFFMESKEEAFSHAWDLMPWDVQWKCRRIQKFILKTFYVTNSHPWQTYTRWASLPLIPRARRTWRTPPQRAAEPRVLLLSPKHDPSIYDKLVKPQDFKKIFVPTQLGGGICMHIHIYEERGFM